MNFEDVGVIFLVVVFTTTIFFAGMQLGKHTERTFWTKHLPDEMNKVCLECAGIR